MDTPVLEEITKPSASSETALTVKKGKSKKKARKKIKALVKLANSILDGSDLSKKNKKLAKAAVKLLKEFL